MNRDELDEFIEKEIDKSEYIEICDSFKEESEILQDPWEIEKAVPFNACVEYAFKKGWFEDLQEYRDPVTGFWDLMYDTIDHIAYDQKLFTTIYDLSEDHDGFVCEPENSYNPCEHCTGEDCACCEVYRTGGRIKSKAIDQENF